jgi:hypothetical protein
VALSDRNHQISLSTAAALTKRHQAANPKAAKAEAFHGDQVAALLRQPGCVGMRVYYGLNADGTAAVVLTGMDSSDNDLTGTILEYGFPCPPYCGGGNTLNNG